MVVIIDYDMGNVGSIANIIKKVGGSAVVSRDPSVIRDAERLILPGVGAFDTGMENIERFNLFEILNRKVLEERIPILGVCLGMQLLGRRSEEGSLMGFGWIDGDTVKFAAQDSSTGRLKIPHMGWNYIHIKKEDALMAGMYNQPKFYFVHSYHFVCRDISDVLTETTYGLTFTSAVSRGNIWGTQFHPEKSHKYGMKIYQNFIHKI